MMSLPPDDHSPVQPGQPEEEIHPGENEIQPIDDEGQVSVEILRQKHIELKNRSTQIDHGTWEFLGEQWCELVYQIEDLKDAEALLKEGVIKFSGRSSESKLRKMLEQVQRALYIQSALEFPVDRYWPSWIERPNAYKRAVSLAGDIEWLVENQNWPALRERALRWRSILLENVLPAYLDLQTELAHQQARGGDFALALQTIQNALMFLPEHLVSEIPDTVDVAGMTALRNALVARQECEVALWRGTVRLVNEGASFQEVDAEIESKLIDHPDVDMGDLRITLADMRKAAGIESALGTITAPNKSSADSSRLERLSQTSFSLLDKIPAFLEAADPRLAHKLQARISKLLSDIDQAPKESLKNLIESFERQEITHPNRVPDLVERYWQLKWYLDNGQIGDPDQVAAAQEALEWTQQRPHHMLLEAAELFEKLDRPVKLQALLINLDTIRSLSDSLSVNLQGNWGSQGASNPAALVDRKSLDEWYQIVSSWIKIYHTWSQRSKNDPRAAGNASFQADSEVKAIHQDLKTLKFEIWDRLELPAWREDSPAGRIESESNLFLVLMEVFQQVETELKSRNPIEIAIYLDERLLQTGLYQNLEAPTIWFWEPLRRSLLRKADAQVKSIQSSIDSYLGDLLEGSQEPLRALEQNVFLQPVPEMFVPTVKLRTENHARRLSNNYDGTVSKAEWSTRWDNVISAVRTWAGDVGEETKTSFDLNGLWLRLINIVDWGQYLNSIQSRRREIGIALGLVAFLIVFIFGGSALLRRSNQAAQRSLSAAPLGDTRSNQGEISVDNSGDSSVSSLATQVPSATHTPTEDTRYMTATAQAETALEATQAAASSIAATQTQQADTTASAFQAAMLEQTATAGALQDTSTALADATITATADPSLLATNEALRCFNDSSAHTLEVSAEPVLNPAPGATYVYGSQAFPIYASWQVTNLSQCDWNALTVASLTDDEEPRFSFWDEIGRLEVSPDTPVKPGESLKVILSFSPLDALSINQEWALVANELVLNELPHLKLNVQDWIIPVEATLTSTPRPTKEDSSSQSTSAPPTARP